MAQVAQVTQVAQVEGIAAGDFFVDGISGFFEGVLALGDSQFLSGLIVVLLLAVLLMLYSNRKVVQNTHKLHHDDVKNVLQNLWGMESAIKTYIMESRSYRPKGEMTIPIAMQESMANMSEFHERMEKEMNELLTQMKKPVDRSAGGTPSASGKDSKDSKEDKEAQNRLEAKLEAIIEQIKADRRDENNAAEIGDKLRGLMEQQGVYLHDEFAAISDKISALQNAVPSTGQSDTPVSGAPVSGAPVSGAPVSGIPVTETPVSGAAVSGIPVTETPVSGAAVSGIPVTETPVSGAAVSGVPISATPVSGAPVSGTVVSGAAMSEITDKLRELREMTERLVATMDSGVGQPVATTDSGVGQAAVLEMLTQSMNRLSSEVDAKLTLLNERLERNLSARWTDALGSINTLRSRLEEFSSAGDQIQTFSNNIASLSRMMMSRVGDGEEGGRQKLAELLSPLISSEHFSLDFDLPNGHCAAALVRFPDYNVCVDAGLSLQTFIESMDDKLSAAERDAKRDAFRRELASQVNHVADHLIMPPHTGESALMFVASEAAFAEIHTRHRMIVQMALSRRVWIVSPTTFMAIINTANSAIRDRDAYARLREMQEKVVGIVEEVRGFENRLAEIGDHVNSAWRSIQRAEGAGNRLAGSIRDISHTNDDRDIQSLSHDKSA